MLTAVSDTKVITGEMLLTMGDVGPCELVEGEIVPMSPTNVEHAYIESEIGRLLGNFAAEQRNGWVFVGEIGIYTQRNPDTVRGADVVFISKERAAQRPRAGFLTIAPDLVVEVVSPHDRWSVLHDKIEEYFTIGVTWVWMVEPGRKVIRVYTAPTAVEVYGETAVVHGQDSLSGFQLSVGQLFT